MTHECTELADQTAARILAALSTEQRSAYESLRARIARVHIPAHVWNDTQPGARLLYVLEKLVAYDDAV